MNMNMKSRYEYLAGEDLGYNSDVIQKAKFEYSPLGKVLRDNAKCKKKKK